MFPPRKHSIQTLKRMVKHGEFGEYKESGVPGEVMLAEDAIKVHQNKVKIAKQQAKAEKQKEKYKRKPKTTNTHFSLWENQPSEYRIAAKKKFKQALTYSSVKAKIAACKDGAELKAYLKQKYENFYARVQWGHKWKAKDEAWSHTKQREYFESALDMKTQVRLLFDEKEQEYFWQQLVAYAMVYGLANPVKKDLIKQIIFESIYIQKRRGQLVMHADDVIDKTFLNDLNVSQERFLKLVNTLNAIHYKKIVPTGKADGEEPPPFDPTSAGDDIE